MKDQVLYIINLVILIQEYLKMIGKKDLELLKLNHMNVMGSLNIINIKNIQKEMVKSSIKIEIIIQVIGKILI